MSVYGLKSSVLKVAGAKVIATDHRDTEKKVVDSKISGYVGMDP